MTQILLNISPPVIGTPSGVAALPASSPDDASAGIGPFRALIARLGAARGSSAAKRGAVPAPTARAAASTDPAARSAKTKQMLAAGAAVPASTARATAATDTTALAAKIEKMLAAGASQSDVISALAEQLASTTAAQLRTPGADTREKLKAVFATALAPPGASSSAANRARDLAQRYVDLERMAGAIAERESGQQNRITGNVSDAGKAKDTPALPTATRDAAPIGSLESAASGRVARATAQPVAAAHGNAKPGISAARPAALATPGGTSAIPAGTSAIPAGTSAIPAGDASGPATSASRAAVSGAVEAQAHALNAPAADTAPASVALGSRDAHAAGDGRTVNLNALAAIATGGDSGLGRTLARAAVAADARRSAAPPAAPAPRAAAGGAPVADTAAAEPAAADAPKVAAFVKAFAAALNASTTAPSSAQTGGQTIATAPAHAADAPPPGFPPVVTTAAERSDTAAPAPPSAPAPPPPPVDHSAIADQVLRGAFMRNVGQSSEMRLSLVPESLGDVSVKLVVNDGSVTAHVIAQTADVRDALVAAQPQLTKSLADAGLKLSSFTVALSDGGFAGFSQQQNGRPAPDGRPRAAFALASLEGETDEAGLAAIPSFGPSIAADAGDYNYLA